MKIRRGRRNTDAAGLILVVAATLATVIMGCIIYHIYKWAKRASDGSPVAVPGITNSDNIPTPGNPMDITSAWWEDVDFTWRYWDGVSASGIPEPEPKNNVMIKSVLDGTNLLMSISVEPNNTNTITFQSIGFPVDNYGIPSDFSWSLNRPEGEWESWVLQRSTNLIDWDDVGEWRIWAGFTNCWMDEQTEEKRYYRAFKQ